MAQYDYLIFDADHTLIDFDEDERRAFRAAFRSAGKAYTEEWIEECWRFSAQNWADLGLTEVHLPDTRARYHALYYDHVRAILDFMDASFGLGEGRERASRTFSETLARPAHLVDGAQEVLDALGKRYRLCIATNGLSAMQAGRLSDVRSRFAHVFVSEEMGLVKPDVGFFRHVLAVLGTTAERCLMIGDSLSSDVAGANAVGMDCVWFHRRQESLPPDLRVKAVISDLRELLSIL